MLGYQPHTHDMGYSWVVYYVACATDSEWPGLDRSHNYYVCSHYTLR